MRIFFATNISLWQSPKWWFLDSDFGRGMWQEVVDHQTKPLVSNNV